MGDFLVVQTLARIGRMSDQGENVELVPKENNMKKYFSDPNLIGLSRHIIDMDEIKHRCLILHISIYGQSHKAEDLSHAFPSMEKFGLNLVTVLDQFKIKTAVVMGDGAGANLALRFGMNHPTRTSGLVLLNCTAAESSLSVMEKIFEALTGTGFALGPDEPQLNQKNIALYADD